MDAILVANYADGKPLHGVLSPYDGLSRGIISALVSFGWDHNDVDNWPIVTGQDAEAASVKMIRTGEQFSTILKDTRDLARVAADMVEAVLEGREPTINDTSTYNNNVKIVPSYLLVPYTVDITNYRELVIDSGYLSEADIS
jgi:putative multiple sugar transport system substrate-binding protein